MVVVNRLPEDCVGLREQFRRVETDGRIPLGFACAG